MEALTVLVDPILPVFVILAFGFVMGRTGRVGPQDARLINRLAMSVFLPIMIFGQLSAAPLHTFHVAPILVYAGCEAVIFAAMLVLLRRVFRREAREAVLLSMCGVYANTAIYILAIAILIYGQAATLPVTAVVTLDSIFAFGGAMMVLQLLEAGRLSPAAILGAIARTPLLQAILLGLIVAALRLPLPAPVQTFVDFNGVAAAPVALFALGVVLSETPFRADRVVATVTAVKLILFPAAVWLGLELFAPDEPQKTVYLLCAAGPAGAMAFSLAILHDVRTDAIAQVMVWTGVLTLLTLAVLA